jgi:hypothetical protein
MNMISGAAGLTGAADGAYALQKAGGYVPIFTIPAALRVL